MFIGVVFHSSDMFAEGKYITIDLGFS
ncbi:hypothetical protein MCP1_10168 [Candidatus Terasakiella magnetica]|nr:hypothetical protein MCP1_10168 [Candidatus Terasakiella magnetica]